MIQLKIIDKNGKEGNIGSKMKCLKLRWSSEDSDEPLEKDYFYGTLGLNRKGNTIVVLNKKSEEIRMWNDGWNEWYGIENLEFEFID